MVLQELFKSQLKESKEIFKPTESVYLEVEKYLFKSTLIHLKSIQKLFSNDELLQEYDKWININHQNILHFESRRSHSNFSHQFINDNLFKCYLFKSIYTILKDQLKSSKPKQKMTSYVWQNNPDKELPELYRLMKDDYELIAPDTAYKQFEAVFTGKPIQNITPIKWHQDNASELLYFNEAITTKVDNVWPIFKRMTACFIKPDGKPFKAAWKSLKTHINENLSERKQKAINELVSNF